MFIIQRYTLYHAIHIIFIRLTVVQGKELNTGFSNEVQ